MRSLALLSRQPKIYILEPTGNRPIKESNRNPSVDLFDNRKEQFIRFLTLTCDWSSRWSPVRISVVCLWVQLCSIDTIFSSTNPLKWWYFRTICFVRGEKRFDLAITIQLSLSSNILHFILVVGRCSSITSDNSCKRYINGITSQSSIDRAIY